ncbi:hypothetical protein TIFTF001_039188 [Ficus carica]|uniref:Retrotransposon gag domain-containing protein n=1 Tax=Ficus carica TaxID=3494 RepID=A0AA88JFM0_FICCA|nr:hypothetical protein TIFTF001_039188 [Ficus carica]
MTSTSGFDDLARGVRETPLTKQITNSITPEFSNISFPRFDGMSDPHDHLLQYKNVVQSTNIPTNMLDDMMCKLFAKPISEIFGLDDGTAREALKKCLRHKYLCKNEICARYPLMIQDVLHRAKGFIELEEENDPSKLIAHLRCQDFVTWPKKLPENSTRDTTKYCEFHKDHGHQTIDCRALRAEVAELLKKGYLREFLTEKGRETYGLGNESKERKVVQQIEDTPSPPAVRIKINVIFDGSIYSGETKADQL